MNDIVTHDENVKKELLEHQGNILVLANAGSGKTTFLTKKLKSDSERLNNYQKLAAITFTRNATEEIKQKLVDIPDNVVVSTIDSYLDVLITNYEDKLESQILLEILSNLDNKKLFDTNLMSNNLIMTTHGSKGLAADTVVIFVEYLIDRYKQELKFEDHYVAITRAKSKVIIIDNQTIYTNEINRFLRSNNGKFSFEDFI